MDCLIVSCSQRKKEQSGPAINVYDGNLFRILRNRRPAIDLFILSAKYGLIPATDEIVTYNQKLLRTDYVDFIVNTQIQYRALIADKYDKVYVCMSDLYFAYLEPHHPERIHRPAAGIGVMQQALVTFLSTLPAGPTPAWVEAITA